MAKSNNFRLTRKSLNRLIDKLDSYSNSLESKMKKLVRKLADLGIKTANETMVGSEYGKYITISKEEESYDGHFNTTIIAVSQDLLVMWDRYGETVATEISPLLFEEFGSGNFAENPKGINGVGQGTFPSQTHAFEPIWKWKDLDGNWHESSGYAPSAPMYTASVKLASEFMKVVKEVFSND